MNSYSNISTMWSTLYRPEIDNDLPGGNNTQVYKFRPTRQISQESHFEDNKVLEPDRYGEGDVLKEGLYGRREFRIGDQLLLFYIPFLTKVVSY